MTQHRVHTWAAAFTWLPLLLLLLCARPAHAVLISNTVYNVTAGKAFDLTWTGSSGPVTINLVNGSEDNSTHIMLIDSALYPTHMAGFW